MGRTAASPLTRAYDSGAYGADIWARKPEQEPPLDCEMALKVLMFQTARIQRQLNLMTLLAAALLALLVLSK